MAMILPTSSPVPCGVSSGPTGRQDEIAFDQPERPVEPGVFDACWIVQPIEPHQKAFLHPKYRIRADIGIIGVVDARHQCREAFGLQDEVQVRLTSYIPAGAAMTLTVARDVTGFALTLAFGAADLSVPTAFAWLDEVAARLDDPIRQLI